MSAINQLLELAAEYGRATGADTTTVSWRLFGDSKKLGAIIDGRDIQVRRFEKAVRWLAANWPETAKWPDDIVRPICADDITEGGAAA